MIMLLIERVQLTECVIMFTPALLWQCKSVSKHLSWLSWHTSSVSSQHTICLEMPRERERAENVTSFSAQQHQPRPPLWCWLFSVIIRGQSGWWAGNVIITPSPPPIIIESGALLFSPNNELMSIIWAVSHWSNYHKENENNSRTKWK